MNSTGAAILMYHWVNPKIGERLRLYGVTPRAFARQMTHLKASGFVCLPLGDLLTILASGRALPPRAVVITFDDGYVDNVENAGPVLESLGWTATLFLVTDRVGGFNAWDERYGDPPRPLIRWDQARSLDGGIFRFEPHSRTHPLLTTLALDDAREEILGSKRRLEDELGRRASVFSYPHGAFDRRLEAIVREVGFEAAVTDRQGLNDPRVDPFRLRRTMITSRDRTATFAFKVRTGWGCLSLLISRFHEVSPQGHRPGVHGGC